MIFVFVEDGTLEIVADVAEARRNYEGVDVENEVVRFFNEQGQFMEPNFIKPNRYGKILWLLNWCESGEYELIPNPNCNTDSLGLSLSETEVLMPNKWFKDLDEVKQYFEKQGINLELKPEEP